MPKLIPIVHWQTKQAFGYRFWCPACRELHPFYVSGPPPLWAFDGNMESPTFGPSLRMIQPNNCHLFVQQGMISYCPDSRHELAGKIVPMVDFDTERWCPVSTLHTINGKAVDATATQVPTVATVDPTSAPPPVPTLETHQSRCGDVGIVGGVCPSCGVSLEK